MAVFRRLLMLPLRADFVAAISPLLLRYAFTSRHCRHISLLYKKNTHNGVCLIRCRRPQRAWMSMMLPPDAFAAMLRRLLAAAIDAAAAACAMRRASFHYAAASTFTMITLFLADAYAARY